MMNQNHYKNMPLTKWMTLMMMPKVNGAKKYKIGQDLTTAQAEELKRIIAQSMEFDIDATSARKNLDIVGTPYRDFIVSYTMLILATDDINDNWANALWNQLWFVDQLACKKIVKEKSKFKQW